MNVLFVTANWPPELLGGTERVVLALARACSGVHGDDVTVVAGSNRPEDGDVVEETYFDPAVAGVSYPVVRIARRVEEGYGVDCSRPRLAEQFARVLDGIRPDVVHVHHQSGLGWSTVRTVRAAGIPVVLTSHDAWPVCPRFFRVRPDGGPCPDGADRGPCIQCINDEMRTSRGEVAGLVGRRDRELRADVEAADWCTVPSAFMARALGDHLPTDRVIDVVPHGLLESQPSREAVARDRARNAKAKTEAADAFRERFVNLAAGIRERTGIDLHHRLDVESDPGHRVIGTFGNLVPVKGVQLLLDACVALHRRREQGEDIAPFRVELAGEVLDPEFIEGAVLRASECGLVVSLPGPYDPAGASGQDPESGPHPATYLDLAVFPSLCAESYGLVVDEALAHGVPVVVSDRGALSERIGDAGVAVDVSSSAGLERRLAALLADGAAPLGALRTRVPSSMPSVTDAVARYRDGYARLIDGSTAGRPP